MNTTSWQDESGLDTVHHVAVEVDDVAKCIQWYTKKFNCRVKYKDDTWALIEFDNVGLALVTRGQHPPHIGFVTDKARCYGELMMHRDGTRSIYTNDPAGNAVELLDPDSVAPDARR